MKYGCIGKDVTYSFSTEIHGLCGNDAYELKSVPPKDLVSFLEAKDFCGINVTMPYKKAVLPFLSKLGEEAIRTGVVNTIRNADGELVGDNTDYEGLRYLLRSNHMEINGKTIMILGDGGTSQTAFALAVTEGARDVIVVSRHPDEAKISYEQARFVAGSVDGIINTTCCGMTPNDDETPISLEDFSRLAWVADVVYRPLRSRLVCEALMRGISAVGGLRMLVAQAVKAEALFGLCQDREEIIEDIYRKLMEKYENLVYVGMPGVGKTKIGRETAEKKKKLFFDSDEVITAKEHRTPEDIIVSEGENAFREKESSVIFTLSQKNGCVISTGGGVVEREENIRRLKQNGKIIYLSQTPSSLPLDLHHPLSDTREKIDALYQKRKSLYENAADEIITM